MIKLIVNFFKELNFFSKNYDLNHNENSFDIKKTKSYLLQRKLILLISNIDKIDKQDIKFLEYKRIDDFEEFFITNYEIQFHNKEELENFKKKYFEYLL